MDGDSVLILVMFLLFMFFIGEPDLHDALVNYFINCQQ